MSTERRPLVAAEIVTPFSELREAIHELARTSDDITDAGQSFMAHSRRYGTVIFDSVGPTPRTPAQLILAQRRIKIAPWNYVNVRLRPDGHLDFAVAQRDGLNDPFLEGSQLIADPADLEEEYVSLPKSRQHVLATGARGVAESATEYLRNLKEGHPAQEQLTKHGNIFVHGAFHLKAASPRLASV